MGKRLYTPFIIKPFLIYTLVLNFSILTVRD